MAAPTPVSALVHSSTLVTAGIYIFFRLNIFFSLNLSFLLGKLGFITIILGRFCAFVSFDRKKVIAYSTLRKLGIMGVSIALGSYGITFFHLLAHGLRKALLFISTGKAMHFKFHYQDLRNYSKIWIKKIFILFFSL